MTCWTRRQFVTTAALSAAALRTARANAFGLPLGLQLYSVRDQLQADYAGTLKQVAALGYREVESAGFYKHSPEDAKAALGAAGLHCVSAHYPGSQLAENLQSILQFHKELGGTQYIICASPVPPPGTAGMTHQQQRRALTLDDWKRNAAQFNTWGKTVRDAGFRFGYHNHTEEFRAIDGTVPYDVLLKETDPALVVMELDCGWVTVGGSSPEHYLSTYSNRIKMLHVKDFAKGGGSIEHPPEAAELGRGVADYTTILKAAKPGAIEHMFVEQEAYPDLPWQEALKVDAAYMTKLKT